MNWRGEEGAIFELIKATTAEEATSKHIIEMEVAGKTNSITRDHKLIH